MKGRKLIFHAWGLPCLARRAEEDEALVWSALMGCFYLFKERFLGH